MSGIELAYVLFAASVTIQVVQAEKMRAAQQRAQDEADARADAARGFQLVTSGEPTAIPVVYGRAKVGGNRVYHNTFSNYVVPGGLDATLSGLGVTVLKTTPTEVVPEMPVNKVRVYFKAQAGFDPAPILNTNAADWATNGPNSMPVIRDRIERDPVNNYDRRGPR